VSADPIQSLSEQIASDPALRAAVEAALDRCDRTGSLSGNPSQKQEDQRNNWDDDNPSVHL
jgi:hypothetical protein